MMELRFVDQMSLFVYVRIISRTAKYGSEGEDEDVDDEWRRGEVGKSELR